MLQLIEHDTNLRRRQRPVARYEMSDGRRPDVLGGIVDLLSMQDREAVDLFHDIANVDCDRRRTALFDRGA